MKNGIQEISEERTLGEVPLGAHPNFEEAVRSVYLGLTSNAQFTPRDHQVESHFLYCKDGDCLKLRESAITASRVGEKNDPVMSFYNGLAEGNHLDIEEVTTYIALASDGALPAGIITDRIQSHILHCRDPQCKAIISQAFEESSV